MLKATNQSWSGTRWQISADDGQPAATLELASIRSAATWSLGGRQFRLFREQGGERALALEADGQRLATATRTSLWRRTFIVRAGGDEWTLAMVSAWKGAWELSGPAGALGRIQPVGVWRRSALIDLPDELPIELRIFLAAIVLLFARDD
ncbi:MAG TPA: hypothetical protein VD886_24000, partial [Herpetosiphonaceae bacterium]|nr:hypothetical protein [Herpetosiphonaceae bacterium]